MNGTGPKKDRCGDRERDPLGRFSGPRLNVEQVPRLPTFPARWLLDDPRGRPYLVVWQTSGAPARTAYALRLEREGQSRRDIRLVFADGRTQVLELAWRPLPYGADVPVWLCPRCREGVRYVYFHKATVFGPAPEPPALGMAACCRCHGLRWAVQGRRRSPVARAAAALLAEELGRVRVPYPRRPWDPVASSSPRFLEGHQPDAAPGLLAAPGRRSRAHLPARREGA